MKTAAVAAVTSQNRRPLGLRPPLDGLAALRRTQEHLGPFRGTGQASVR